MTVPMIQPQDGMEPTPEQVAQQQEAEEQQRRALATLYGRDFPLASDRPSEDAHWIAWAKSLWEGRAASVAPRIHAVERNRRFRDGDQWISSTGTGPWREPPRPKDAARIVSNLIKPALDLRHQVVSENRPGFRAKPTAHDPASQRKAEAQQRALEYQFDQQQADLLIAEATYWALTDGVSFPCLHWDPDRGPWFEAGAPGEQYQGGDIAWRVYRIEQVRVSPNATAATPPDWWVIRVPIAEGEAVGRFGPSVVDAKGGSGITRTAGRSTGADTGFDSRARGNAGSDMLADERTVDWYLVYCRPTTLLPQGLQLVVVGDVVASPARPLPWGVVPIWRHTDGSTDPAFYPKAVMEDWIGDQMMINAALSKWVESVRRNADGRFIGRAGAVVTETLIGGVTSLIETRGGAGLSEALQAVPPSNIGSDVKELLSLAVTNFERKSGWNDATRGSFDKDASGRSILAQREVVERTFAPLVRAASVAMAKGWAPATLHAMRWGYTEPRKIGVTGQSRSDLAVEVTSETFDGIADVTVDPETMMPMPRSLRLFLLDEMRKRGDLTPQEHRRRLPFAFVGEIESPDEDQHAAAKRACYLLRQGVPAMQIMQSSIEAWVWDEALWQDVIQRDLLLPSDIDPMVKQEAFALWSALAEQASMKMGPAMGAMPPEDQGGGPPQGNGEGAAMDPRTQPLAANNPSVGVPVASDQDNAVGFDRRSAL
jgi:hypothetical protein